MKSKTIVIPGKPQGKGRPRFAGGRAYTPQKTRDYEDLIRACWLQQADGWRKTEGPIHIVIRVYCPIPKSMPKKKRARLNQDDNWPTVKPDADNVIKVICDALNGYAYSDDRQIVGIECRKWYDENPRVEVEMYG